MTLDCEAVEAACRAYYRAAGANPDAAVHSIEGAASHAAWIAIKPSIEMAILAYLSMVSSIHTLERVTQTIANAARWRS